MKNFIQLIVILLLSSCSVLDKDESDREVYYVKSANVYLPVIVSGKKDSKETIFFVHGGPGSTSLQHYYTPFFSKLKQQYRIVMYDQRGSGGARGKASAESLTLDQHVKDLDAIIDSVKLRYPDTSIYMMGLSYGGMVSSAYASQHEQKLSALILLVPALNLIDMSTQIPNNMLDTFINPILASGSLSKDDRKYWEEARDFYQKNNVLELNSFLKHNSYICDAYPLHIPELKKYNDFFSELMSKVISDPVLEVLIIGKQVELLFEALDKNGESKRNLETDPKFTLNKITIPSMLVVGTKDLTVPPQSSINSYATIGSAVKNAIIYDGVGHDPIVQASDQLFTDVIDFIKNNP